jgi:hypothetical protein
METTRFENMIGVQNLVGLVKNTAPFFFTAPRPAPESARLSELGDSPTGWLDILWSAERLADVAEPTFEQREDYFALCLACHHATVATFVPTDVDSKIRGLLWVEQKDTPTVRRMFSLSHAVTRWDTTPVTTRFVERPVQGRVSGHNGEWFGVLAGALGTFLRRSDTEGAEEAAAVIDAELQREAELFRTVQREKGQELDLLRLAALLTHNVGDLDQGISFWPKNDPWRSYKPRFHRLAHENKTPYGGTYQLAAHVYKKIMAPEGHRNYPLREVKPLRRSQSFLMPLAPFLDEWGAKLGASPLLETEEKAEVLGAFLLGCKKIPGQVGYYRAIAGMASAVGELERLAAHLPVALRQMLKDPEVKRHLSTKQVSFESSLRKRTQAALAEFRP